MLLQVSEEMFHVKFLNIFVSFYYDKIIIVKCFKIILTDKDGIDYIILFF